MWVAHRGRLPVAGGRNRLGPVLLRDVELELQEHRVRAETADARVSAFVTARIRVIVALVLPIFFSPVMRYAYC